MIKVEDIKTTRYYFLERVTFPCFAGEALSFYLSRMLGLDAVPAVALTKVNSSAPQWQGQDISQAQWHDGRTVAMIQWIEGLDMER